MQKRWLMALPAVFILGLTGCAENAQQRLNDQTVAAINWTQQSGEYQALTWQAFNVATQAFDNAVSESGKPGAVIVDLDETMLDNSAYQAWQAKNDQPFTDASWSAWTRARQARAVPGAVEFAGYVDSQGGTVFYGSNREK